MLYSFYLKRHHDEMDDQKKLPSSIDHINMIDASQSIDGNKINLKIQNKLQILSSFSFYFAVMDLISMALRERETDYLWHFGLTPLSWIFTQTKFSVLQLQLDWIFGVSSPILRYEFGRYYFFGFFNMNLKRNESLTYYAIRKTSY